ncbi:MAG: cation-transporting P-type ATPase, partial [Comamonadaceae bacterium]
MRSDNNPSVPPSKTTAAAGDACCGGGCASPITLRPSASAARPATAHAHGLAEDHPHPHAPGKEEAHAHGADGAAHDGHDHGPLPSLPRIIAALAVALAAELSHLLLPDTRGWHIAGMALAALAIGLS